MPLKEKRGDFHSDLHVKFWNTKADIQIYQMTFSFPLPVEIWYKNSKGCQS